MASGKIPHVALLIETSREYARGLLRGVARYHQEHGPWSIYFEPHGLNDPAPTWLKNWQGDGILGRIQDRHMADAIIESGIPAVDLRGVHPDLEFPFIGVDNRPVSELAFDHLQDCGLRHFAFCGTPRGENPNQDRRCDYFVDHVEQAGFQCQVFLDEQKPGSSMSWERQQERIAKWLVKLPKPVGIMTCHDDRGHQVLDACRRAELRIPDEVAVLGVDNDVYLCKLATPQLSSIDVNPSRIGYEAAALLARIMDGESPPTEPVLLGPPRGVAARQSTDMLSVEDEEVAIAIRYIREHAIEGIKVSEVVRRAKKSPSTLERRIKRLLGRTIKAEITRVKLVRAKRLLSETELPIAKIAIRSGFSEPKYFCDVFRKNEDMTATAYRNKFRDLE
ncbi:AraC family transcriptional regulator [Adhaeretor mobilis]|uniref:AraC family transcriptional regulator n=1 Tax=Adhaeretor mobilis TaxID=1930276 RepID=UPI001C54FB2D|nr:DNA-binding transcriptional regulator [Adhaeretor mobilis]